MKITKVLSREMGQDVLAGGLAPVKKNWITAAMAGVSLASSLFGGVMGNKAAKEQERLLKQQQAKEEAWHTRRMNEHYVDSAAGQNLINRAKDVLNEQTKKAAGAKAVAGGTDASVAVAKEQANKALGDTISNIAANDTARKDAADQQHMAAQERYANQQAQLAAQKAQATADAASGASNALMSAASSVASGLDGKAKLDGGTNGGHAFDWG